MTDIRQSSDTRPISNTAPIILGLFGVVMIFVILERANTWYHAPEGTSTTAIAYLTFWAIFNLLVAASGMIFILTTRGGGEPKEGRTDPTKLLILCVGGLFGLSLTLLGIMYGLLWWNAATGGLFSGRDAWKGGPTLEHWRPYIVLGLTLGGLAIMLVSILVVRS